MTPATLVAPTAPSDIADAADLRLDQSYERAAQAAIDDEVKRRARQADGHRFAGTTEELLQRRATLAAEACGTDQTGDPYYSPSDFLAWHAREVEMGCTLTVIGPTTIAKLARVQLVPNARLRERFEQLEASGDLTVTRLAIQLNDQDDGGHVDTTYVKRMLDISSISTSEGRSLRMFVNYDQAVALADALGVTYHDLGV